MYGQSEKNLLSSNMSSTCPHNMVNFGPLAAEIDPVVWGAPVRQPNFAALNRGRHLCSAGRPPRWALAHILVLLLSIFFPRLFSAVADWMSTIYLHTWCGLSANLGCTSEMCCKRVAEKTPKIRHLGTIARIYQAVSLQ